MEILLTLLEREWRGDREQVERIVKVAGRIIGVSRQDFGSVYTDLLMKKLHHVLDDDRESSLHDRLSGQLIARSERMLTLCRDRPVSF